jgi:hypothetical protein
MTFTDTLDDIARQIGQNTWGRSRPFGGAGIVVQIREPQPGPPGFYPDPAYVVTPYASELSWLIEQIRDVAREFDNFWEFKMSLFPRLAACANACGSDKGVQHLLLGTLYEAYTFLTALDEEGRIIEDSPISFGQPVGQSYQEFPFELIESFYRAREIPIRRVGPTSPG